MILIAISFFAIASIPDIAAVTCGSPYPILNLASWTGAQGTSNTGLTLTVSVSAGKTIILFIGSFWSSTPLGFRPTDSGGNFYVTNGNWVVNQSNILSQAFIVHNATATTSITIGTRNTGGDTQFWIVAAALEYQYVASIGAVHGLFTTNMQSPQQDSLTTTTNSAWVSYWAFQPSGGCAVGSSSSISPSPPMVERIGFDENHGGGFGNLCWSSGDSNSIQNPGSHTYGWTGFSTAVTFEDLLVEIQPFAVTNCPLIVNGFDVFSATWLVIFFAVMVTFVYFGWEVRSWRMGRK